MNGKERTGAAGVRRLMRKTALLVLVCLTVFAGAGCGFWRMTMGDPYTGNWIGVVKLPVVGRSLTRLDIQPVPGNDSRYRIRIRADRYKSAGTDAEGRKVFVWQKGDSAEFEGQVGSDELRIPSTLDMSLVVGKITGTLELPDGTVVRQDTGKEYEELRKEMADSLREKYPGCRIDNGASS